MGGSSETNTNASSSLLGGKKKIGYRDHYVNGMPFTICMGTFAVVVAGCVAIGSSMLVAGGAKEAQELWPVDASMQSKVYGAKHAGVGFANYVVGNEVQNFWKTEMGGKKNGKMTDPFSFMVKKGKKAQTEAAADASDDDSAAESPQHEADDAQPVDSQHHTVAGAPATDDAIRKEARRGMSKKHGSLPRHAQDVASSHDDQDKAAEKGAEHILRLLRTGRSSKAGKSPEPHLHPGMFHEKHAARGRSHAVQVPSKKKMQGIESASQNAKAARGGHGEQKLLQDNGKGLVVTSGRSGIPELHIRSRASTTQISESHVAGVRTPANPSKEDNLEAMRTLKNAQKDMLQKVPGHVEPVRKADAQGLGGNSGKGVVSKQRPNESYFAYKWRISH